MYYSSGTVLSISLAPSKLNITNAVKESVNKALTGWNITLS
jgi:hypothetical protein